MTKPQTAPFAMKAIVKGRVQGVYYRVFTQKQATTLQINGFVRNLRDLSVEVYAEGERAVLEQFLERLREGPPGARVDGIEITWSEPQNKYETFSVIP